MVRNVILIIVIFSFFTGITIYLQARIHVKYMVSAVDTEGIIFKECAQKLIKGENIKNIKSLKKNIKACQWSNTLIFLVFLMVIIAIEIILNPHITYGNGLYIILCIIYCIYNVSGLILNQYKKVIISEYLMIFASIQTLKSKYGRNSDKIPFTFKIEIYNLACDTMEFKNKNGNKQQNHNYQVTLHDYLYNHFKYDPYNKKNLF